MTTTEQKPTKTSDFIESWPNLDKLIAICGNNQTDAARHIGLTGSGLSTMLQRKKVKLVYELAAATILRRMSVPKETDCMMVLKCSPHQKAAIMTLVNALGVMHLDLDL